MIKTVFRALGVSALSSLALLPLVWATPNTNITVEASSNDVLSGNDRDKEDSWSVPIDGDTSVGFNDDGNPGVFNRF